MAGVIETETLGYLVPLCTVLNPSVVDHSGTKVLVWGFYGLPPLVFCFVFSAWWCVCPPVVCVCVSSPALVLLFFFFPQPEGKEGQEPSVDRLAFGSGSTGYFLLAGHAAGVTEVL